VTKAAACGFMDKRCSRSNVCGLHHSSLRLPYHNRWFV